MYDVAVLGGGNAALCAAITARKRGLSVLIVEAAPIAFRGGNSRHTRNMRTMHEGPLDVLTDASAPATDGPGVKVDWECTVGIENAVRVAKNDVTKRLYVLTSDATANASPPAESDGLPARRGA